MSKEYYELHEEEYNETMELLIHTMEESALDELMNS